VSQPRHFVTVGDDETSNHCEAELYLYAATKHVYTIAPPQREQQKGNLLRKTIRHLFVLQLARYHPRTPHSPKHAKQEA
jgi:hypothetical protein